MNPSHTAQSALNEIVAAGARAAPPASVAIWNAIAATPAEKWLTYLTIAYVVLQAVILFRDKVIRDRKSSEAGAK